MTEYCEQHASYGMINVNRRKCTNESCGIRRSLGVAGTKTTECRAEHALDGIVDVTSRMCKAEGCGKRPSYGVKGTRIMEYCAQHAPDAHVGILLLVGCSWASCSGKYRNFGLVV